MRGRPRAWEWLALGAITLGALLLRLIGIGKVSPDPFYDAAVRSMTLSLHNFFFGAFEPGGSVSIDKPPVDLWLQVASVKLLGFSSTTLKLPEVLAGTLSVPILGLAVRRIWSPAAGIAAALALAILPVEVITARSDTMDAVMMLLLVLALLALVRASESGAIGWLLLAAATLGIAFDVKLLESVVALPGLALFAYFGLPGSRKRRLGRLAIAGVIYVAVALAWLTATLLVPAHERPYAIGSTNGSAWNAAFVFNGTERLGGKSPEPTGSVYVAGKTYPVATQEERDHIPIVPPSATRLLARVGPLSGERLGLEVLIALLLGVPALIAGLRMDGDPGDGDPQDGDPREGRAGDGKAPAAEAPVTVASPPAPPPVQPSPAVGEAAAEAPRAASRRLLPRRRRERDPQATAADRQATLAGAPLRLHRAAAAGLPVWLLCGIVLFSHMIRLHPRYVEGFTPAVAAMVGIGVTWAAGARGRLRLAIFALAMIVLVYYSDRLLYGRPAVWWIVLSGALAALALAAAGELPTARAGALGRHAPAAVVALTLLAVLAIPVRADVAAIHDHVSDAGYVGALPLGEQSLISSYVRSHQDGAYYELAAESSTQIGSLIVKDALPVRVLTTYNARVFTSIAQLQALVAAGKLRYAFLNTFCTQVASAVNPACAAPVKWVRAHGRDVSRLAGLSRGGILYLLPGASP